MPSVRFPAMAVRDGIVYGGGGMNGQTQLIRWNTKSEKMELFQDLLAPKLNDRPDAFTSWRWMMNINFSLGKITTISVPVTSGRFILINKDPIPVLAVCTIRIESISKWTESLNVDKSKEVFG